MKTKKIIAGILMVALVLTMTCLLVPIKAEAATGLTGADFITAKNNPGVMTDKGITYVKGETEEDENIFVIIPGEYILTEDITLSESVVSSSEGDFILDLNGKEWSCSVGGVAFNFEKNNVTIKGNGIMTNPIGYPVMFLYNCNTTIVNGTFNGTVSVYSEEKTSLVIEDANMNDLLVQGKGLNAVINGGEYTNELESACAAINEVTLTINGGTFTAVGSALYSDYNPTRDPETGQPIIKDPPRTITINGGTFKSLGVSEYTSGGIILAGIQNVKLNGGTFISEGDALGAIVVRKGDLSPQAELESFLGDGYKFSEDLVINIGTIERDSSIEAYYTQKTISVVKKEAATPTSTDTTVADNSTDNSASTTKVSKAPKTSDNCIVRLIGYLLAV